MIKNRLISVIIVAGLSAGMVTSASAVIPIANPYEQPNMPAIVGFDFSDEAKDGFPLIHLDWYLNPTDYSWNPENAREGKHPDREDGVVYIFKDKSAADAWWNPLTNPNGMPEGIPDTAVAYIHWALDNASGLFPGIMAMTDDFGFQNNNCIMSSGVIIINSEGGEEKKTCDNEAGSAKRFKMVILKAGEPIDIVFNMTRKDLVYSNYSDPPTVFDPTDPELPPGLPPMEDITDDIFRNYRYLTKVGNGTGTDTVAGPRTGTRLAGVKTELGFGIGDDFDATKGAVDGLLYETDQCVDKRYWDIAHDHPIGQTDYCNAEVREVFLPHEFATFSPAMYAPLGDNRNPTGGYWDINGAGLVLPPTNNIVPNTPLINPESIESSELTPNYFDVAGNQASTASPAILGNVFGYIMDYGVISEGDPGTLPMGIYIDEDGNPATEGSIYAWWDGSNYRWGMKGGPELQPAWSIVSDADIAAMEARPLSETETLEPPRFEFGYLDDLGGLNMDTFIKITPDYDVSKNLTFTVRLTGIAAPAGTADGPWVGNEPDTSAFESDAPADTDTTTTSSDGGSSGFGLSWITAGLLALGLLLRRRRF
jgi:hypothetical protein